ncbi:alkylation response protein AidB-like acyl-CoA dehydrogenase [Azospirillum agricola]|uniref:acyl-CoA dehydrogenase n=1 Tax=Azospirillum agricola TaxID=1720247 RepID=UPI001B3B5F93|nr:acyl-CoA dehydrogenase [Azospirillum agricola]MBP2227909.1 alkylation response protein AidB-like acyl-CoA dehydrogenase [Azospirillum agricola]
MGFKAPVDDILFTLRHVAGLTEVMRDGLFDGLDDDLARALLEQAGAFAEGVLAPLNRPGDRMGVRFADGAVRTPPGFPEAYRRWAEAGWNAVAAPEDWGGAGLPVMLNTAVMEMHTSACMAFGLGPVLTQGAVDALLAHGDAALRERWLPRLVSGAWTATMNLTEPQAGSDLALLRTRAVPAGDGTYRITGQKIFITCGEHDLTDNIVHLVLARLPDAPAGTRGISLFLVPKRLPGDGSANGGPGDGAPGAMNDVRCAGVEHKLGLHASPTCTMVFGDGEGAVGWLVGEENRGLACMFTMMNRARLATGLQGVSIGERACQQALAYARERRQGRVGSDPEARPIIEHPDVRRTLLTMRALTAAARAVAYVTAEAIDRAERGGDAAARERADLLTPVTKAFCSEAGIEVASLGIQVHGGMGFVEETGAAQHLRDVRVTSIYEGTNGIQAIDLVTRKLPRGGGAAVRRLLADWRGIVEAARRTDAAALGASAPRLGEALDALGAATDWLLAEGRAPDDALAGASPFLRLFGLAAGGVLLLKGALAALALQGDGDRNPALRATVATARFYAENLATAAPGLARTVTGGAASLRLGPDVFA